MQWALFGLGLIDTAAGVILLFNEGAVKYIGVVLLGKEILSILKSLR